MLKTILQVFRREAEDSHASAEDYEAVFSSEEGQRVLLDLMARYRVGKPSFSFNKLGNIDLEASARSDAAKVIVADIVQRGKLRLSEAETSAEEDKAKSKTRSKITRLPTTATSV